MSPEKKNENWPQIFIFLKKLKFDTDIFLFFYVQKKN